MIKFPKWAIEAITYQIGIHWHMGKNLEGWDS
jgi:hypothetical protein